MYSHVLHSQETDVSEEYFRCVFRVEKFNIDLFNYEDKGQLFLRNIS
jgi:hypothetical protein